MSRSSSLRCTRFGIRAAHEQPRGWGALSTPGARRRSTQSLADWSKRRVPLQRTHPCLVRVKVARWSAPTCRRAMSIRTFSPWAVQIHLAHSAIGCSSVRLIPRHGVNADTGLTDSINREKDTRSSQAISSADGSRRLPRRSSQPSLSSRAKAACYRARRWRRASVIAVSKPRSPTST